MLDPIYISMVYLNHDNNQKGKIMSDKLLYDEYEQEQLFIELAESIVSECDSLEELESRMQEHRELMSENVIPSVQACTLDQYINEGLSHVFNEFWGGYNG